MTPEQIKEELRILHEQSKEFLKAYNVKVREVQSHCPHEEYHWQHQYIEGWDEHYFTGECIVCGHTQEIEYGHEEYYAYMDKYWNGELE